MLTTDCRLPLTLRIRALPGNLEPKLDSRAHLQIVLPQNYRVKTFFLFAFQLPTETTHDFRRKIIIRTSRPLHLGHCAQDNRVLETVHISQITRRTFETNTAMLPHTYAARANITVTEEPESYPWFSFTTSECTWHKFFRFIHFTVNASVEFLPQQPRTRLNCAFKLPLSKITSSCRRLKRKATA